MVDGLFEEDACQVPLVRKLTEHSGRRAPHGKAEINGIAKVDGQCQSVDDQKDDAAQFLIGYCLLEMQGEQHQHDIRNISYKDGTRVEHQSATEYLQCV